MPYWVKPLLMILIGVGFLWAGSNNPHGFEPVFTLVMGLVLIFGGLAYLMLDNPKRSR